MRPPHAVLPIVLALALLLPAPAAASCREETLARQGPVEATRTTCTFHIVSSDGTATTVAHEDRQTLTVTVLTQRHGASASDQSVATTACEASCFASTSRTRTLTIGGVTVVAEENATDGCRAGTCSATDGVGARGGNAAATAHAGDSHTGPSSARYANAGAGGMAVAVTAASAGRDATTVVEAGGARVAYDRHKPSEQGQERYGHGVALQAGGVAAAPTVWAHQRYATDETCTYSLVVEPGPLTVATTPVLACVDAFGGVLSRLP